MLREEIGGFCPRTAVNPQVLVYLNRLSDLLFVLARVLNGQGSADVLWVPGGKVD